jgi:hypothetical protein
VRQRYSNEVTDVVRAYDPTRIQPVLTQLNRWTLTELPRRNRFILAGRERRDGLATDLTRSVLTDLPDPDAFTRDEARQVVVDLGFVGASVARHYQEADLARKVTPTLAFEHLSVGEARTPFPAYFACVADGTGTGHGGRDCYASLVRWNAPDTEVRVDGRLVATLPGAFDDEEIRTYTGDPGEIAFFELLKKSEALELAVNDMLEPIIGDVDNRPTDALSRVRHATRVLDAMSELNLAFVARPVDAGGLSPQHFMDVFRQFAVHWAPGDIPPTGAQDPEFIRRDLILGIAFPDYHAHVRRLFPALLDGERAILDRLMDRRPLPDTLLESCGLDGASLLAMSTRDLRAVAARHPTLAAVYLLLTANARFSSVHLTMTQKFLFKPQRERDAAGIGDSPLVSNRRGTTGMDSPQLVLLTRARRQHVLTALHEVTLPELTRIADAESAALAVAPEVTVEFVARRR